VGQGRALGGAWRVERFRGLRAEADGNDLPAAFQLHSRGRSIRLRPTFTPICHQDVKILSSLTYIPSLETQHLLSIKLGFDGKWNLVIFMLGRPVQGHSGIGR
jgi:hypothetical protein